MFRRILDPLFEQYRKRRRSRRERDRDSVWQFEMPVLHAPQLVDTQFRANALNIARQVLGATATQTGEQAIIKPPGARETPWHQDEAYWSDAYEYASLTVWMAVDDVDIRNGCLQYVPRSHDSVRPHRLRGHIDGFPELELIEPPASTPTVCPLTAGGATIHLPRTMHFAGPNQTTRERRAYVMGFGLPPTPSKSSQGRW